ncbi:MAG: hypothetical protein JWO38_5559 [Gemmataceae bacterium]|nr:hypothetical protein [Gemmataceae bacterium]
MKRFAVVGVALALAFSGGLSADDKVPAGLEGTYKAVALTRDGKDEPADLVAGVKMKITGGEMIFSVKDKSFPAKFKVDSKAKPATIDIAPSDGPEKGKTFPGIYKVEDDELLIAFTEKGDRPTEFKGENGVLLFRLKRDEKK